MKVFLSHIHEEASLALVFKEWIESSFPSLIQVFVSSDIKDVPAGKKWFDEINKALGESQAFIVLCSPNSIQRPWINFETGCAWIKDVPVIAICHSGQCISTLPRPLSDFQDLSIDDPDFIDKFLSSLAEHFGIEKIPRIDKALMLSEISNTIASFEPITGQKAEAVESPPGLDEIEEKILVYLAEHNRGYSVEELAIGFNILDSKMQYYLDNLYDRFFIKRGPLYFGSSIDYRIDKGGRKYLVDRGLL